VIQISVAGKTAHTDLRPIKVVKNGDMLSFPVKNRHTQAYADSSTD